MVFLKKSVYLWFELADATNYVNDVGPGMVLLYIPV